MIRRLLTRLSEYCRSRGREDEIEPCYDCREPEEDCEC